MRCDELDVSGRDAGQGGGCLGEQSVAAVLASPDAAGVDREGKTVVDAFGVRRHGAIPLPATGGLDCCSIWCGGLGKRLLLLEQPCHNLGVICCNIFCLTEIVREVEEERRVVFGGGPAFPGAGVGGELGGGLPVW